MQHGAAAFTRIPPIGAENEGEEEGDGLGGRASNLEVSVNVSMGSIATL